MSKKSCLDSQTLVLVSAKVVLRRTNIFLRTKIDHKSGRRSDQGGPNIDCVMLKNNI